MSVSSLNVSIGAKIEGLQKGLRQAERELRQAGQRLANAGDQLTQTLTLSIGALGIGAIKAAGDFEALRLAMRATFEGAGRSIQQADKELEALRKSALAPGLDFEQAVKASIRLQAVGLSAENARDTIEELANAVATTGGTAANLESVTAQMSQMISKGRVLSQDLRIIQENLPAISGLMKKAFGTSNAEDLQKLGITGKEFVSKITAEMAKLPRVAGGINNAIVNAGSAIKQFLVTIGDEINKAFDIGKKSEQFAAFLGRAAEAFKGLSDGTKRFVIEAGLVLVAIGPVLKVMGAIKLLSAQVVSGFSSVVGGLRSLAGGALSAASAFSKMNLALKITVIGAAIAAVTALYFAYQELSNRVSSAVAVQREVDNVNTAASQSIQEQKNQVEKLTGVLDNHNATQKQRKEALAELNRISPEYFGNLKVEKGLVIGLKEAQDAYISSLLRAALVKAAEEKIVQLQRERLDIQDQLNKATATGAQTAGNVAKDLLYRIVDLTGAFSKLAGTDFASNQMSDQIENFGKLAGESVALETRLRGVVSANTDFGNVTATASANTEKFTRVTGDNTKKIKESEAEYDGAIRRVKLLAAEYLKLAAAVFVKPLPTAGSTNGLPAGEQTQSGFNFAPVESLKAGAQRANAIAAAMTKASLAVQATNTQFTALAAILDTTTGGPLERMNALVQGIQEQFGGLTGALAAVSGAIADSAASGAKSFAELGAAALEAAAKIAQGEIIKIALRVAANAVEAGGIFGAIAAVGLAGVAIAGLNALVASVKPPKFAHGTNSAPGGLSLVGELGPELVNLPKGSQVTPNSKLNGMLSKSNDVNVSGTFRVQGTDLLLVMERAQNRSQRTRGF